MILHRNNIVGFALVLLSVANAACSEDSATGHATGQPNCLRSDAIEAEKAIDEIGNWEELHDHFEKYSACDMASIAEGLDDVVIRLLLRDWKNVDIAVGLANTSPQFGDFIARHVTELAALDELQAIQDAATTQCPIDGQTFCRRLIATIEKLE